MTTLSDGNGLNFRHYLDICSNQQVTKKIESDGAVVDIINRDQPVATDVDEPINADEDAAPVLDIIINNVVCNFNVRCHLNLKQIALNAYNVEYKREHGMVTMKLRRPYTTASIWSSGKITCTGATSDADAKKASRKIARIIQQLGFKVKFSNFRIVNVLGTCSMPFGIRITPFSAAHRRDASYEPEIHPGVTYKIKSPELKATLKIFSTGSITITAPSIDFVRAAVEHIFPLVYEFRKVKEPKPDNNSIVKHVFKKFKPNPIDDSEDEELSEEDGGDFDSDISRD